jgi:hypothetical protein
VREDANDRRPGASSKIWLNTVAYTPCRRLVPHHQRGRVVFRQPVDEQRAPLFAGAGGGELCRVAIGLAVLLAAGRDHVRAGRQLAGDETVTVERPQDQRLRRHPYECEAGHSGYVDVRGPAPAMPGDEQGQHPARWCTGARVRALGTVEHERRDPGGDVTDAPASAGFSVTATDDARLIGPPRGGIVECPPYALVSQRKHQGRSPRRPADYDGTHSDSLRPRSDDRPSESAAVCTVRRSH